MATRSPPPPICKAFLVCRHIADDAEFGDAVLVGLPRADRARHFPAATPLGFFARLTAARGSYQVEVQLRDGAGAVRWREGPPDNWRMPEPLELYDLRLNVNVVFPAAGAHEFVLVVNGEDVARQPFHVAALSPAGS